MQVEGESLTTEPLATANGSTNDDEGGCSVARRACVTDSVSGGTYRSESVCQYVFEFVCSVEFLPCGQEFSDVRDSRNACVAFGLLGFEVRMVGVEIATLWCANSSQPSSLTL